MPMKKILEKVGDKKEEEEEFLEIPESVLSEQQKLNVRIESLRDFVDTERIQQFLREGNIVFLRIKDLRNKDLGELKRAVDKLRKTCLASGGDIVGIEEDYLILTPNFARIYRGK